MSGASVVNASVAAAWFLPDEATSYTEAALDAARTADLWLPDIAGPESSTPRGSGPAGDA